MAMDVGSKGGLKGDINVTPLIDVVLVLLIIFMVLTPSMLKHLTAVVPKKTEDRRAGERVGHRRGVHGESRADDQQRARFPGSVG